MPVSPPAQTPTTVGRRLYPHQRAAVDVLVRNRRFGLFDDQGLGKTCVALVASFECSFPVATGVAVRMRTLVLCPSAVLWNWARECREWLGVDPTVIDSTAVLGARTQDVADVVLTTHSLLLSGLVREYLQGELWNCLIVDESHEFRSAKAKRTKALYGTAAVPGLITRANSVWVLSGTPTPNNPSEIYSFLRGLFPIKLAVRGILNSPAFIAQFCRLRVTPYGSKIVGAKNSDELRRLLSGTYLRRLKSDVLDLPATRWEHVTVGSLEDAEVLRAFEEEHGLSAAMDLGNRDNVAYAEWRRLCGQAKVAASAALIAATDGPVVVFAHHLAVLDGLEAALSEHGVTRIDGSVSAADRTARVAAFQGGNGKIFLGQTRAAGVGITLTRAAEVVLVEPSFVPAENAQAVDRAIRIGQTASVRVRFLSMACSVDQDVTEALRVKTEMIDATIGAT